MIDGLVLVHLEATALAPSLGSHLGVFVLKTCQRILLVGHHQAPLLALESFDSPAIAIHRGQDAYRFLLETICGLKSRLAGESEIVAQFKTAYMNYTADVGNKAPLCSILEKLFKDAKSIRSQYLLRLGFQTYAGIVRRQLIDSQVEGPVLIVGTGELANEVVKLLKRRFSLVITGRNAQNATELAQKHEATTFAWENLNTAPKHFKAIINTVGADKILFGPSFFDSWEKAVFIDLGSPSVLETSLTSQQGVFRLGDVFDLAERFDSDKGQKLEEARHACGELAHRRLHTFAVSYPFGWEDLQFA
jgi:glutamyl-tRNA reductase